ncbi:MAG: flagella basal body P-ring formation protein FlgA [Gammaproteobacteria bacterium]|nr:MAG: flagella basal body P-ring formation protein FlgA [Gammaproteobacteria bacterium]
MDKTELLNRGLLLGMALLLMAAPALAWQSPQSIRDAAAAAARAHWSADGARVDAVADELDPRLRLADCGGPLAVKLPFAKQRSTRVTAEVSCPGPQRWKLYVPVRLAVFRPVVVAARALPRDSLLTADDISLAEQDIGRLDYGYLGRLEDAIGQRLRRPLAAGEPVTPGNLETPPLVRRGQRVTLEARNGGLTVRTAGIALGEGIRGQVIDVKNLSSGRAVQAIVRSAQSAEVLLQ